MFCSKCGKENPEGAKFCSSCGVSFEAPGKSTASAHSADVTTEAMTFAQSITTCLSKYATFKGRASRSEFWWFVLFCQLLSWGAKVVDQPHSLPVIVGLAFLIPSYAAQSRRLHDTNRSAWWLLLYFTIIGIIPLIIWFARKGDEQSNSYGSPSNSVVN
jgi:uncharacterized membrane protein YhaH (DUF805 family)